ncbi:hypothetical protein BDY24DRAFT_375823 [Mrakia frigida]|uniref:uncharacterized protein n=1 Tax=Mrakia frigida TaxID=29902 RepID=UPI003FCBF0FA
MEFFDDVCWEGRWDRRGRGGRGGGGFGEEGGDEGGHEFWIRGGEFLESCRPALERGEDERRGRREDERGERGQRRGRRRGGSDAKKKKKNGKKTKRKQESVKLVSYICLIQKGLGKKAWRKTKKKGRRLERGGERGSEGRANQRNQTLELNPSFLSEE